MQQQKPKSKFMRLVHKYGPVALMLLRIINQILTLVNQVANYGKPDELRLRI